MSSQLQDRPPADAPNPGGQLTGEASPDERLRDLGYEPALRRRLGLGAILVYGLLFFVPMAPVAVFGVVVNDSGGVPVLVYLVAALVMSLSAVSYSQMSIPFPVAGSVYGYVTLGAGRRPGFVAGWLILLDYILMPGLLTILGAAALGHLLPGVPPALLAAAFVLASLALNLAGITVTTRAGFVLLAAQGVVLLAFLGFVAAAAADGRAVVDLAPLWRPGATSLAAVLTAVSIAALSYLGFDAVATLNEEARGGGAAIARATMLLMGIVTAIFVVVVYAAAAVARTTAFAPGAATDRAFYDVVATVAPPWFVTVFTLTSALVAIFACLVVAHASTARLVFSMARDGNLPRRLAATSRRGVPAVASLAVAGAALLVGVGLVDRAGLVTSLVTFGALSSYVLLHASVVVHHVVRGGSRRWVTHVIVPVAGSALLIVALVQAKPLTQGVVAAWLGVGLVAAGLTRRARRGLPEGGDSVRLRR